MFITPPPADSDEETRVFFGQTGSMSSIDLVEGGNHCDSANSLNFESTRRPDSYFVDSTSESDSNFSITLKRKVNTNQPSQSNQPFSKKRRLAEAAALETSMDDSFMNDHPDSLDRKKKKKTVKKTAKKTNWTCHVCGSADPQARARCACGKYIHKDCKTYGVCSN